MSQYLEPVIAKLENNANSLNQETQATVRALQVLQALNEADGALVITATAEKVKVLPAVEVSNERAMAMLLAAIKTIILNVKDNKVQNNMLNALLRTYDESVQELTPKEDPVDAE